MQNHNYQTCIRYFLESIKFGEFEYRCLTDFFAKASSKNCLFWTIRLIEGEFLKLYKNDLVNRTVKELRQLERDYNPEKAKIFDELSYKNWIKKGKGKEERKSHLPLARISWACLCFICNENRIEFTSNYLPGNNVTKEVFKNLDMHIGIECSYALSLTLGNDKEIINKVISTYSKTMKNLN